MDEVQVMTRRPTTTAKMKLDCLANWGIQVRCLQCFGFYNLREIEWDHCVPLALGGEHTAENLQPLCPSCHKHKTHGGKHAFHTSDRGKINKVKRQEAARLALERGEEKAKKHRPIQSRGFDKSLRKKLDGTVEERK